VQTLVEEF